MDYNRMAVELVEKPNLSVGDLLVAFQKIRVETLQEVMEKLKK